MAETNRPTELKRLDPQARTLVDERFLSATAEPDFKPFVQDFGRVVMLDALTAVIEEAMARFESPIKSDAWLAPRLFAALRLSPKEAADQGLWQFLALVVYPDYVRWRWTPRTEKRKFNIDNFIGSLNQQAISRLWWSAELLRNGSDYTAVQAAHALQDITSTLLSLNLVHNRGAAIAITRYAEEAWRTGRMTGRQLNKTLSKKFRAAAMTRSIDELAPISQLADPAVIKRWTSTIVDPRDVVRVDDGDIPAPEDEAVAESAVTNLRQLLEEIAPFDEAQEAGSSGETVAVEA